MDERLKQAFGAVRADEAIKERTKEYVTRHMRKHLVRRAAAPRLIAAAACLLLIVWGGWSLFFTETATISIDVNPSLELGVNRFDRVVSARGMNEDGEALASSLNLMFRDYESAVEEILASGRVAALLADDAELSIVVVAPDGEQCEEIYARMEACASRCGNAHCYRAHPDELSAAHEVGLSYGKYRALLEWQELDPGVTADDVRDRSMREIRDCINALSGDDSGSASGGHHAHRRGRE